MKAKTKIKRNTYIGFAVMGDYPFYGTTIKTKCGKTFKYVRTINTVEDAHFHVMCANKSEFERNYITNIGRIRRAVEFTFTANENGSNPRIITFKHKNKSTIYKPSMM